MDIDALQQAILSKDADGVVAALADWDETDRAAAAAPFNVLMLALGFERDVITPCSLEPDDRQVLAKRRRDGIEPRSSRDRSFDHEMHYIAWLARYGLLDLEACKRFPCAPDFEAHSAQVMADRRPPWWQDWYRHVVSEESSLSAHYWSLLYQHGLVAEQDFPPMARSFAAELPDAIRDAPAAVQQVLRDIPACRELVYAIPQDSYQLFNATGWTPVISWLSEQQLLDSMRFWRAVVDALHQPHNQTERNGCLILARAAVAEESTLAKLQPELMGLVADSQASVAGFAVEQLRKLQQAGLLNHGEAVAVLPTVFGHKPKTHSLGAIEMLDAIAGDSALRPAAVEAVAAALMHPNRDVQKASLGVLEDRLQEGDAAAIEAISLHSDSIAATLKPRAAALLNFDRSAPRPTKRSPKAAKKPTRTAAGEAGTGSASVGEAASPKAAIDVTFHERAVAAIPVEVRQRLRIDQAIDAARNAAVDPICRWNIQDMRVLASATQLVPIDSVEELVDLTAAAVESCDNPDTVDRILSGIARLCRKRPSTFRSRTSSLGKRACAHISERPPRGLVGGKLGRCFSLLISAWLEIESEADDYDYLDGPIEKYLIEVEQRVRAGTSYSLLSEATHSGGWIAPDVWVQRLIRAQQERPDFLESDLVRSCLRLAPDDRDRALRRAVELQPPLRALALAALGGEVEVSDAWPPNVWIAVLRARDPYIDLSQHLPPEERGEITSAMAELPDVIFPSDYRWQPTAAMGWPASRGLVEAWPTGHAQQEKQAEGDLLTQMMEEGADPMEVLARIVDRSKPIRDSGFFPAQLHAIDAGPAPPHSYPYYATQWPMKLDWYWCMATKALSRRVESGPSVEERYDRFLLPLLELDRPLTSMAARALWIATISKDGNSQSMAKEVWLELAGSDRADVEILLQALKDIEPGGWVKLNRIGEALAEVAAFSPLHAWVVASVLEAYLASCESLPRDAAKLLEPLDECCERLGRAASPQLAERLKGVKSGKAKPLARSLIQRVAIATPGRQEAVVAALQARIARARRVAHAEQHAE